MFTYPIIGGFNGVWVICRRSMIVSRLWATIIAIGVLNVNSTPGDKSCCFKTRALLNFRKVVLCSSGWKARTSFSMSAGYQGRSIAKYAATVDSYFVSKSPILRSIVIFLFTLFRSVDAVENYCCTFSDVLEFQWVDKKCFHIKLYRGLVPRWVVTCFIILFSVPLEKYLIYSDCLVGVIQRRSFCNEVW